MRSQLPVWVLFIQPHVQTGIFTLPEFRASSRAPSSTLPPRETLMMTTPSRILGIVHGNVIHTETGTEDEIQTLSRAASIWGSLIFAAEQMMTLSKSRKAVPSSSGS